MSEPNEIQEQTVNQEEAYQQSGTLRKEAEAAAKQDVDTAANTTESETKKLLQELHAKIELLEGKMKAEVEALYSLLTKHGIHHAPNPGSVAEVADEAPTADEPETKAAE